MKRRTTPIALGVVLALLALMLSGCWSFYKTAVIPPPGFIYSDVSAPLIPPRTEAGAANLSDVEVYTTQVQVPLLWGGMLSAAWGDSSIQEAIDSSGFSDVVSADYHWFSILSVYNKFTVQVYGRR